MSGEMDEIWELYADDGAQSLDAAEEALLALQNNEAGDPDAQIAALFRAVHTFKGNSRVLGLATVENRAHLTEDLIGMVRDDGVPLDEKIIEVLIYATDVLRTMLEETAHTRADVDPEPSEELIEQLKEELARAKVTLGQEPEASAAPVAEAPAAVENSDEAPISDDAAAVIAPSAPGLKDLDAVSATLSQLDGSTHTDDSYWDDEPTSPVVEETSPEEPVETAEVAEEAAEDVTTGEVFTEAPRRLADDPTYRDIFNGMVEDTKKALGKIIDSYAENAEEARSKAEAQANNLSYAAGQMGLSEWQEPLDAFVQDATQGVEDGVEAVAALLLKFQELSGQDPNAEIDANRREDSGEAGEGDFLSEMQPLFGKVSQVGMRFRANDLPSKDELTALADDICAVVEPYGYVRVTAAAKKFADAESAHMFRWNTVRFFEELAAVETVLPKSEDTSLVRPSVALQSWAADQIFENLNELTEVLGEFRQGQSSDELFGRLERLLRLVSHGAKHVAIDTASQLAMALVDLFSRVQLSGRAPDPILLHMARGFIDTIELVFDAVDQGEAPDMDAIDRLFEEASNVCFTGSGMISAAQIEKKLGLPKAFHRVMSPESVQAAAVAMDAGKTFHILRTDLNDNEAIAEKFLNWVSSGKTEMITNVTVFEGDKTLFDFLIATDLDEAGVTEAVHDIDPRGAALRLEMTLAKTVHDEEENEPGAASSDYNYINSQLGLELLETIGEVSASQSMVHHMLDQLVERDLASEVDAALREQGLGSAAPAIRSITRKVVEEFQSKLREAAELEHQLTEQMSVLQEESVAMRARPADVLLKPLTAFVESQSRMRGNEVRMSTAGGDVMIDQALLETMRGSLRTLLTARLDAEIAPEGFHMLVRRDEDKIVVMLEDNSPSALDFAIKQSISETFSNEGGNFRSIDLPSGGVRFHLELPLSMVVLDGMVVRVGDIHYVVPVDAIMRIHQAEASQYISVSARSGKSMIRVTEDEIIPVCKLRGSHQNRNAAPGMEEANSNLFVIVRNSDSALAIPVDELLGQQLVLLRPLKGMLSSVRDMTGVALLAGGEVGMVVAVNRLNAA